MMIVPIITPYSKKDALEVVESLRKAIEEGQIVAFAAVGLEEDDTTRIWTATTKKVTRLRVIGAMHHMLHCYECGDE